MFNPQDFLSLSQILIQNTPDECKIRTSIGRSYYATFLYLREWLRTNMGTGFYDTADDHEIVRDSIHDIDGRTISDKYKKLRRYRNHADYKLSDTDININKANEAIKLAEHIISKYS